MMRSLYSGVSGLRVHQTKMDVIGNNISNVNTVGFKSSTVNFSDIFYQTTQSATGPNSQTGTTGQNAMQIGLGANLASIKKQITTQGGAQRTDNPFDVMINGDSFFVVSKGGSPMFTKSGAFEVDANGTLCTSDGAAVMGWQTDPNNPEQIVASQVSALNVMGPQHSTTSPEATSKAYFTGNIDQKDTSLVGTANANVGMTDTKDIKGKDTQLQFYDSLGNLYTAKMKVTQLNGVPEQYAVSLVDVLDTNGDSLFVMKDNTGNYVVNPAVANGVKLGDITYKATITNAATGEYKITADKQYDTSQSILTFDSSKGTFVNAGKPGIPATPADKSESLALSFDPGMSTGSTQKQYENIAIDFSTMTMQQNSGKTTMEGKRGTTTSMDGAGKKLGNQTDISIGSDGKIYGSYDNGDKKLLGQIAVATFANPSGLESVGSNCFVATQNSGDFDGIGKDITGDGGKLSAGVLEMSNVDLSQQFTDMITTQRGFQANSRIITTSDTMLEELINLKR